VAGFDCDALPQRRTKIRDRAVVSLGYGGSHVTICVYRLSSQGGFPIQTGLAYSLDAGTFSPSRIMFEHAHTFQSLTLLFWNSGPIWPLTGLTCGEPGDENSAIVLG